MNSHTYPDTNTRVTEIEEVVALSAYMAQLAKVMTALAHHTVLQRSYCFVDRNHLTALIQTIRQASALGKELLAEIRRQKKSAPIELSPLRVQGGANRDVPQPEGKGHACTSRPASTEAVSDG